MANPARLLAGILAEWREVPPHKTPESSRNDRTWARHRLAVRHLLEIEQFLRGMDEAGQPAEVFHKALPQWTAAVLSYNVPWQSNGSASRAAIDPRDLALLESLAVLMETAEYAAQLESDTLEPILAAVEACASLIRSSGVLSNDSRRYLLGLVTEARTSLEEIGTFGEGHARRVLFELGGAMTSVAYQVADDQESPQWRQRAADLLQQITLLGAKLAIAWGRVKLGLPPGD